MDEKRLLTTNEVAALLGVTPIRVRKMIQSGQLRADRFGRSHMIRREDAEAAKVRRTTPGRPVTTGAGLRRRRTQAADEA